MAWRCSGRSNAELIQNLVKGGVITRPAVEQAMLAVDRQHYCRAGTTPYQDAPQPIGFNQTISAPHMHAMCLEGFAELLKPGMRVLDAGSGSGYLTACFYEMVGAGGAVRGIEYVKDLVPYSLENLHKDGYAEALRSGAIQIKHGDGSKGWEPGATFDVIHVGAAAPQVPKPLVDALAAPGVMIIPVGTDTQVLTEVAKSASGAVTVKELTGVRYVPFHMDGTEVYA
eukprot:TRINITY_DN14173_c0_g1_i1.p2 TRINITY_DN14173_c0_g1~~TRINITY_DN14173_c0_g1_i1.p2  ORF type:complete len:250 (+),score=90.29 TRINITY_DN14173_c0_g1_i1:71-751(+)